MFRWSVLLSSFLLFGHVTNANSDTFTTSEMLYGFSMTRDACNFPDTSVWVTVDGKGECIRYFHSGLQRENDIVHVWMHGDRMAGHSGRQRSVGYRDETPQKQQKRADRVYRRDGIPYIRLSRPGTYGSSGNHGHRRRPHNVKTVLAAFDALKEKYSIRKFAISGQSGGGHLVGALLAERKDVVCAVPTAGALAVLQRIRARGWSLDATGYWDFWDPIDHAHEIPADEDRRIFVVGDPGDTNVPFAGIENYFKRVKELGHDVYLIRAKGRGKRRHGLGYAGFQITKWCVDGVSSAEILERAKSLAPDK